MSANTAPFVLQGTLTMTLTGQQPVPLPLDAMATGPGDAYAVVGNEFTAGMVSVVVAFQPFFNGGFGKCMADGCNYEADPVKTKRLDRAHVRLLIGPSNFNCIVLFCRKHNLSKHLVKLDAIKGHVYALPASADIIGYLPLTKGFDIYGKFGSSNMRIEFTPAPGQTPINTMTGKTRTFGYGIEFSVSEMQSYRIGLEHFDLSLSPGTSVSTNYINITGLMHF